MLMVFAMLVVPTAQAVGATSSNQESRDGVVISTTTSTPRVMKRVNVWTEKDKTGRTVLRGDARAKKAYQNAQRAKGVTTITAMVLGLMLLVVPEFVQHAVATLGSCLFGMFGITTSDDVKNRLAARLAASISEVNDEGGTRLFVGGTSISEPPEFLDGRQRYNSFDGVTTFPAGIDATLQRERDAGKEPQYKVMIVHGGTQASKAKNPAGSDGGFPIGTIGTSVRRADALRTALNNDATIVDLNVLSECDRSIQQPTTNENGTAEAILPFTGPLTHVGWIHTDTNGKVTLWDINGNGIGLLGTGLEGGEKDMSGLAENNLANQIKTMAQGWIPALKTVEANDGIVLLPVTSTGNTSSACDIAFDEIVPSHLIPSGTKKRVLCDRQDKLPVQHLAGATRKKAASFALLTGLPTPYRNTHVHFGDVRNPANQEAVLLDQWVTIKENEHPGFGPILTDKTDHMRTIILHSRALGVGTAAANLKSPVDDKCVLKPTRDLWLSDAASITRPRLLKLVTGSVGPESLRPTISGCITNAYKQICGSGWSPDIDASDVDLQRDANRVVVVETYLPDDMPMTDERVKIMENAIGSAVNQHFKDAVRGTVIRKPVVLMVTYRVDSSVCPNPVMDVQVMTHLTAACDIMMKDVPVLIEARLTKQSHRVRGDVKYTHLEHEFWQEGITSLEQSNHPKLVALARVLDIIGDNHWKNGALRKDGFSNHVNRDGGGKQPFRNGY